MSPPSLPVQPQALHQDALVRHIALHIFLHRNHELEPAVHYRRRVFLEVNSLNLLGDCLGLFK